MLLAYFFMVLWHINNIFNLFDLKTKGKERKSETKDIENVLKETIPEKIENYNKKKG